MEKIINGKRYNTETAEEIESYGKNYRSFDYVHETLYRKRTGEFFIHGEGGPRSRYAVRVEQNTWSGGEAIRPITDEEARKWLEEHSDAETYERCFAVEEDETERLAVNLSAEDMQRLREYARRCGKSISETVRMMISRLE